jgi:cytochrome c551
MIKIKPLVLFFGGIMGLVACQTKEEIKHQTYLHDGVEKYKLHCANCHQEDGKGLAGLYPPLANSDYLKKNKASIICAIKHGQADTIVVNGKKYYQPMPANPKLEGLDIAEITTYIFNKWGDETVITDIKTVEKALKECGGIKK